MRFLLFASLSLAAGLAAAWLDGADRRTSVLGYVDLLRVDLRSLRPHVSAPVTVLASPSFGAEVVRANMEEQYTGLPDFRLHVAPTGGHYLTWDAPGWTAARLREAFAPRAVSSNARP